MRRLPVVYLAAPFTSPDRAVMSEWIERVTRWGQWMVREFDVAPLMPHRAYGMPFLEERSPEFWYDATMALLCVSDAVVVIAEERDDGTVSKGVADEIRMAQALNLPLFREGLRYREPRAALFLCADFLRMVSERAKR